MVGISKVVVTQPEQLIPLPNPSKNINYSVRKNIKTYCENYFRKVIKDKIDSLTENNKIYLYKNLKLTLDK